jgi:D-glycerate 3-kinase
MKARNGGMGMSDAEVNGFVQPLINMTRPELNLLHRFVDRFIPGYVFFEDGVRQGTKNADGTYKQPSWSGNGLVITIGEDRNVVGVTNF